MPYHYYVVARTARRRGSTGTTTIRAGLRGTTIGSAKACGWPAAPLQVGPRPRERRPRDEALGGGTPPGYLPPGSIKPQGEHRRDAARARGFARGDGSGGSRPEGTRPTADLAAAQVHAARRPTPRDNGTWQRSWRSRERSDHAAGEERRADPAPGRPAARGARARSAAQRSAAEAGAPADPPPSTRPPPPPRSKPSSSGVTGAAAAERASADGYTWPADEHDGADVALARRRVVAHHLERLPA